MSAESLAIPRTLGRWDLVLLKIVAIVNINNVPPVAVYGWASLGLWALAFVMFFVPEAIAVLTLARRHPGEGGIYLLARDLGPAIAIAGVVSIAWYLLVTGAVLTLVPVERLGVIQGVMQAVGAGASAARAGWIVVPLALVMGVATGGAASAWFAGSSRIPFVAGLSSALPSALGRVHPRWHSPHVALVTCAVLAAGSSIVPRRRFASA